MKPTNPGAAVAERLRQLAKINHGEAVVTSDGWQFTYCEVGLTNDPPAAAYVLTAQLWPVGRRHVLEDWNIVGQVIQTLGIPFEATPKSITVDASAIHSWAWEVIAGMAVASEPEDGSPCFSCGGSGEEKDPAHPGPCFVCNGTKKNPPGLNG